MHLKVSFFFFNWKEKNNLVSENIDFPNFKLIVNTYFTSFLPILHKNAVMPL